MNSSAAARESLVLPLKHPVIVEAERQQFRLALHVYLTLAGPHVSVTATHPESRRTYHGRSRRGDVSEALANLAQQIGKTVTAAAAGFRSSSRVRAHTPA